MSIQLEVRRLAADVIRIRAGLPGQKQEALLNKYEFLFEAALEPAPADAVWLEINTTADSGLIASSDGKTLFSLNDLAVDEEGARVVFDGSNAEEDWVGFGDLVRDRLFHRGYKIECIVTDVASYLPVPFFLSTRGYGILVNTTSSTTFDMAAEQSDRFGWLDHSGQIDFYVFAGKDFKAIQRRYLALTGAPQLPPVWSFGLWYICRTQADADEVMRNAMEFRNLGLPCDVFGLEPGWMEKDYDLSTTKDWNKQRFDLPAWQRRGKHHFISALKRMGFHLELWLCCEYDLGFEEHRRCGRILRQRETMTNEQLLTIRKDIDIDGHLGDTRLADSITIPDQPWFEHLKKFVDWGADFFKQDGAFQVSFHPDRFWRGFGLNDDKAHNLYPLCYARQMLEGFENYTGRRGLVFTVSGWTGFQHYCGTWTGDTGGRLETLGAMLNTAMVGHSFCTNDMEVTEPEAIHFGYLLPWSQINSWTYFRMPWTQGNRLLELHRFYGELRARLIPYLYSCARISCTGGDPLMLPLALEFQNDPFCHNILHEYLLGPALLVGIYKHEMYFPAGAWYDFWTGEVIHSDGETRHVEWPADRGGTLYLREGALLPLGPVMAYRSEKPLDEMEVLWFPGNNATTRFEFYEDDGVSFGFREGKFAVTELTGSIDAEGTRRLAIGKVSGDPSFVPSQRSWLVTVICSKTPGSVRLDGAEVPAAEWSYCAETYKVKISRAIASGIIEIF